MVITINKADGFPEAINHVIPNPAKVPKIRCIPRRPICLVLLPCITARQEMGIQYGLSNFKMKATANENPMKKPKVNDSTMLVYTFFGEI